MKGFKMKAKISRMVLLLLIVTTQVSTIFTAALEEEYKNASVIPISWTKDGTALVLLGEEKRRDSGGERVWCDFFGKRDRKDRGNPLITAQREALEESAGQLKFFGKPLYCYQGKKNRSTVHYFWEAKYIEPRNIHKSAGLLRTAGKGHGIEKTTWLWVELADLLQEETGLKLHWSLKDKLTHRVMRKVFESYLAGKPEVGETEEDDDGEGDTE